ncbi:hypothetical protein EVAR_87002_1 [Eumeta japonica]|uniref:Uncharacterized protein n=1 Tax=Eumeta variegata TaxID=151549 RepID=A0A4C1W8B7_EUMVA|nr:hypothetical protein EVAR_87002_1 [Eumeta japonica]
MLSETLVQYHFQHYGSRDSQYGDTIHSHRGWPLAGEKLRTANVLITVNLARGRGERLSINLSSESGGRGRKHVVAAPVPALSLYLSGLFLPPMTTGVLLNFLNRSDDLGVRDDLLITHSFDDEAFQDLLIVIVYLTDVFLTEVTTRVPESMLSRRFRPSLRVGIVGPRRAGLAWWA